MLADENVLERALQDVNFWQRHRELLERKRIVWLLLYDMQGRKFARPNSTAAIERRKQGMKEAGLLEIEEALIGMKTKLAASMSRLRISGSALNLGELHKFSQLISMNVSTTLNSKLKNNFTGFIAWAHLKKFCLRNSNLLNQ